MRQFFLFSGIICLVLLSSLCYSQNNKVIKNIIEIGKTDNQTMTHLNVLCNRFGGRILGSDTYDNAADWCASQFLKWGMKVEMDEAGTLPVGFKEAGILEIIQSASVPIRVMYDRKNIDSMTFGTADTKGYDFNYNEIWHTERDVYNKSIPEYQEHTSIVTAIVVFGVANLDHLLSSEGYYAPDSK